MMLDALDGETRLDREATVVVVGAGPVGVVLGQTLGWSGCEYHGAPSEIGSRIFCAESIAYGSKREGRLHAK